MATQDASVPAALLADALAPPFAWGGPTVRGRLRSVPEDFVVDELPLAEPCDEGEHAWLRVRKRGANTEWVAKALARHAGVRPVEVGYAGLKDRDAVTTQWFSVALQGRPEPDWRALALPGVTVLERRRRRRKLRRGELAGNRFALCLRELQGDTDALRARLARLVDGVPNYFGPQRFGHGGDNLRQALAMFRRERRVPQRHLRGIYLSAARSLLFNRVLGRRVRDGSWRRPLPGEPLLGEDGGLHEPGEQTWVDGTGGPLLPTGPLWGRGRPPVRAEALALETDALAELEEWRIALEHAGLAQERRALPLEPAQAGWELDADAGVLHMGFELPPGAYATVVLREFVAVD